MLVQKLASASGIADSFLSPRRSGYQRYAAWRASDEAQWTEGLSCHSLALDNNGSRDPNIVHPRQQHSSSDAAPGLLHNERTIRAALPHSMKFAPHYTMINSQNKLPATCAAACLAISNSRSAWVCRSFALASTTKVRLRTRPAIRSTTIPRFAFTRQAKASLPSPVTGAAAPAQRRRYGFIPLGGNGCTSIRMLFHKFPRFHVKLHALPVTATRALPPSRSLAVAEFIQRQFRAMHGEANRNPSAASRRTVTPFSPV